MIEPLLIAALLIIIFELFYTTIDKNRYKRSLYLQETQNNYWKVRFDKGLRGEYITSNFLNTINGEKKMTFNTYIPKNSEEETSEIDIIMIHKKGIFVIENKNYTGWIFGKERDTKWCQSLNSKSKNFFYNPIKQNNTHIKFLKKLLSDYNGIPYISVISFNNKAVLKKITIQSDNIIVCNSTELKDRLDQKIATLPDSLIQEQIENIYELLKSRTQVSDEVKEMHIKNIQEKYK